MSWTSLTVSSRPTSAFKKPNMLDHRRPKWPTGTYCTEPTHRSSSCNTLWDINVQAGVQNLKLSGENSVRSSTLPDHIWWRLKMPNLPLTSAARLSYYIFGFLRSLKVELFEKWGDDKMPKNRLQSRERTRERKRREPGSPVVPPEKFNTDSSYTTLKTEQVPVAFFSFFLKP